MDKSKKVYQNDLNPRPFLKSKINPPAGGQKSKIVRILKFGGSSVGSAERIKNVCKIIADAIKSDRIGVVVSAMQGVTDKLLALDFDWVKGNHLITAKELKVPAPQNLLNELENIIKGIRILGEASPMALDLVASFGERLSANFIAAYLNRKFNKKVPKAVFIDARELIKTDNNFQNAAVDFLKTNTKIRNYFRKLPSQTIPIITGFIGSTGDGKTTTLGRGGSDYSAAIFGAALDVKVIEIWSDVDGVMTADPGFVPASFTLPEISYEEAFEMAHFGAKIIHPATMIPAIKKNIPILIKNTFNPKHPGTLVMNQRIKSQNLQTVKNISVLDNISLITIGGTNLAGVPGTAARVFKAVADKKVNVILIAQASSEYTICLAVKQVEANKAINALKNEFESDIRAGKVALESRENQCIVAVVGEGIHGTPGVSGRIFGALGRNKINVTTIAQGGSERNISFAIDQENKNKAINFIHQEFFSPIDTAVFLVGTGNVGAELLKQIACLPDFFKVCGIADINKMYFNVNGIDAKNWKKLLAKSSDETDFERFLQKAAAVPAAHKIFVDCTASGIIAKNYHRIVQTGFHIVTPNKKANVLPMKYYLALRKALAEHKKLFYYDANVGAGLPVIETVKKLIMAGDKIKKIEGIFSGTLSYLFNNFDGRQKFSELVKEAKEKGYTEPDPREDLSGQDVGRKLLILARELGWPAEFSNVKLENLVKPDSYFTAKFKKARSRSCVLRYVGSILNGRLVATLKEIPFHHPLANVSGTDNIIAIYSRNYKNPLVIKGAGAGAAVTAAAVLSGVLRICQK